MAAQVINGQGLVMPTKRRLSAFGQTTLRRVSPGDLLPCLRTTEFIVRCEIEDAVGCCGGVEISIPGAANDAQSGGVLCFVPARVGTS